MGWGMGTVVGNKYKNTTACNLTQKVQLSLFVLQDTDMSLDHFKLPKHDWPARQKLHTNICLIPFSEKKNL